MNQCAMPLPWTLTTVPHAILDILRGCNIRCRDCFNTRPARVKPVREIEAELAALLRWRRLQSVSLIGGEVLLHPELTQIIRMVKARQLCVELFTNGVGLSSAILSELKRAGADVIFLHIEHQQQRPDLPANHSPAELRALRAAKVALISAHGIEAGLAVTVYPDRLTELQETVAFTLESPHVAYLLVTLWRDVAGMPPIHGNLETGLRAEPMPTQTVSLDNRQIRRFLEDKFNLTPFAFLASNVDADDPRWLSYLIGAVYQRDTLRQFQSLRATPVESTFLELSRRVTGRYPFYQRQNPAQFAAHLLLNGSAGGGLGANLNLLWQVCHPNARLTSKRLLFQSPALIDQQGRVIHCHCCPDAVVQDGQLVPVCIADRISAETITHD